MESQCFLFILAIYVLNFDFRVKCSILYFNISCVFSFLEGWRGKQKNLARMAYAQQSWTVIYRHHTQPSCTSHLYSMCLRVKTCWRTPFPWGFYALLKASPVPRDFTVDFAYMVKIIIFFSPHFHVCFGYHSNFKHYHWGALVCDFLVITSKCGSRYCSYCPLLKWTLILCYCCLQWLWASFLP